MGGQTGHQNEGLGMLGPVLALKKRVAYPLYKLC